MESTGAEQLTLLSGSFFGNGLTRAKLDAALHEHWTNDRAARVPELMQSCWFDYRFAHPALRLHFFAHQFTLAWRRAHHTFFDRDAEVETFRPWSSSNIYRCPRSTVRNTMDVMQFADAMLVPYDVFFDAGFRHLFQDAGYSSVMRKHKGLSRERLPPIRLFRRAGVAIAAQTRMDHLTQTRLVHARHPHYRAENWRATPFQVAHVKWLLSEARRMPFGLREQIANMARRGIITPKIVDFVSA